MSIDKKTIGTTRKTIHKYQKGIMQLQEDVLAIESPLLIKIKAPEKNVEDLVITMQTPVHTEELIIGFLYTEGIINKREQIQKISIDDTEVLVTLTVQPIKKAERNTVSTAACGMCGKTSLDAIGLVRAFDLKSQMQSISPSLLLGLDEKLRGSQLLFSETGGIHAAALFDFQGRLLTVHEDIGRHNAVDKAIGYMLDKGLDRSDLILYVSGRAGFELVQKALVSGIAMMVAVGAPSSLATEYAKEYGLTLVGFMQKARFNVYSHPNRVMN